MTIRRTIIIFLATIAFWPGTVFASVHATTPVKIQIPKINVSAVVEARGLSFRKIQLPPSLPSRVAWDNGSTIPGQPGDAVMYGHLTDIHFRPAIFSRLSGLKVGDRITITDRNQNRHIFRVKKIKTYRAADMHYAQLAGVTKFIHLNLYTCAGRWDSRAHHYTHFLVVYTDLVSSTVQNR